MAFHSYKLAAFHGISNCKSIHEPQYGPRFTGTSAYELRPQPVPNSLQQVHIEPITDLDTFA